jgi:type I site-specific restriction endonuclease
VITEADTCRKYVLPKLNAAGWDTAPHSFTEQKTFTDSRIVMAGSKIRRRPQKRADYLLRYTRDFAIAVVEAKAAHKLASDGLQQAKEYAEFLGIKFAYATNGHGIVEFDYLTAPVGSVTLLSALGTEPQVGSDTRGFDLSMAPPPEMPCGMSYTPSTRVQFSSG